MPSSYNYREPYWVQKQINADVSRTLSTKDRLATNAMKRSVSLSFADQIANTTTELHPSTLSSLDDAIRSAKDPEIAKILLNERVNVVNLLDEALAVKAQNTRISPRSPDFVDQVTEFVQSLFK